MNGERPMILHNRPLSMVPANLVRLVIIALLGFLGAAALIIVVRRLAGALENSLRPTALLATGVLLAGSAVLIRVGWFLPPTHLLRRLDRAVMAITSLAVVALGAGLCLPNTSAVGLFVLWTLLGAEEIWAWGWHTRRYSSAGILSSASLKPTSRKALPCDLEEGILPEDITQQLTRTLASDGTEELSGWLRMVFAAGQRTGSLHVAFCPPFALTPELEIEQLDGPEARIKTAQLLPYGARLDLKLVAPAIEPATVLVQFSARTAREHR
jgi:hypothetical protein